MSVTVDFAFNASKALPELATDVNGALGCSLGPYRGSSDDLYCRFLGLEFSLGEHPYEDDRDCDFKRYRYLLDSRTAMSEAHMRQIQLEVTALAAFVLVLRGIAKEGILTYNIQRLLARYSRRGEREVFDGVSELAVEFPRHLVHIRERAG